MAGPNIAIVVLGLVLIMGHLDKTSSGVPTKQAEVLSMEVRMPGGWKRGGMSAGGPATLNCYYCNIYFGGTGMKKPSGSGPPSVGGPSWDTVDALTDLMVREHYDVRRLHGVPNLTSNSTLIASAQSYALKSIRSKPFVHSCLDPNGCSYGENQFEESAPTPSNVDYAKEATDEWYGQIDNVNWKDVEHSFANVSEFTQMVWRGTTQIGCGVATESEPDGVHYNVICHYAPTGNIRGQYRQNVPRRRPQRRSSRDTPTHIM